MVGGRRGGPTRRPKTKALQFALEVSLDDVYKGTTNKMRLSRMRLCKTCKGYLLIVID